MRDYNLEALKRSDAALESIIKECGMDSDRYRTAKDYNNYLRTWLNKKVPNRIENSISIPRDLEGKL